MSEKKRGYYPEMLIDVHNLGKIPLKDYAKDDPSFVVARLCGLSKHYYRREDRIAELEAEVGRLREVVTDWIADVAQRDGGKVFQNRVSGLASAPITYADMRNLMAALSPQVGEKKGCKHCNDGVTRIGGNCEDCGGTGEA